MSALCASLECVTNFVSVQNQQQHFKRYLSLFLSAFLSPSFSLSLSLSVSLILSSVHVCYLLTEMIYTLLATVIVCHALFHPHTHTLNENACLANGAYA